MGNVVCEGMTIVWCGVPSGGSQGHSRWWPSQLHRLYFIQLLHMDYWTDI